MNLLYNLYEEAEACNVIANELEYLTESYDYVMEAEGEGFFQKILRKISECLQKLKDFFFGSKMKQNLENGPKTSNANGKKVEAEVNNTEKGLKKVLEDTKKARTESEVNECRSRLDKLKSAGLKIGAGVGIGTATIVGTSFISGLFKTLTATEEKCKKYAQDTASSLNSAKAGTASKIELGVWRAKTSLFGQIASVCSQFGSKMGVALLGGKGKENKRSIALTMSDSMKDRSRQMSRDTLNSVKDQKFRRSITSGLTGSDIDSKSDISDDLANSTHIINSAYDNAMRSARVTIDSVKKSLNTAKKTILSDINRLSTKEVTKEVKSELATKLKNASSSINNEIQMASKIFSKKNFKKMVLEITDDCATTQGVYEDVANDAADLIVGISNDVYEELIDMLTGFIDYQTTSVDNVKQSVEKKINVFAGIANKIKAVVNKGKSKIKSAASRIKQKLPSKFKRKKASPKTESVYDSYESYDLDDDYIDAMLESYFD